MLKGVSALVEKAVECMGCVGPLEPVHAPADREHWSDYCPSCQSIIGAHRAQLQEESLAVAQQLLAQIDADRIARQSRIDAWEGEAARLYRESLMPRCAIAAGVTAHTLDPSLWPPEAKATDRWVPKRGGAKKRRAKKKNR